MPMLTPHQVASELLPAVASTVPHSPSASRFSRSSAVPQGAALAEALLHAERGLAATHLGGALPSASASASPSVGDSGSPALPAPRTPPSEGGAAELRDGSSDSARGVLTQARESSDGGSETSETSPELPASATKA